MSMRELTDNTEEPYEPNQPADGQAGLTVAVGVAMTVATLYLARDVLVPLVLAALLSFALSPPMLWMRRHHVPRVPSVAIVVTLAFLGIFMVGRLVVSQVSTLADNLPVYEQNLEQKVHSVQGVTDVGGGIVGRATDMLHKLSQELDGNHAVPQPLAPGKNGRPVPRGVLDGTDLRPVPVEIREPAPAPLQLLQSVIGPLLAPLATTGLIVLFVISFLLQRENLRDRFIRLVGGRDLHRTTEALNEAGSRVSRYLGLQFIVNAVYAVPILGGLMLIGVPNAVLWATLVVMLRFVPYMGVIIAAIFPLALSLAVDPGWDMVAWTAGLFVCVELVFGNVVEPWLYGTNTGLSPVAIIVAATFWTWLWGPIGLLLSTPLTVCVVVLGRHAPPLRFLHVLLGNDAPLLPFETFYQRLLADDPAEAAENCEAFIKDRTLAALYDEVVVPALSLAQDDNNRGVLGRTLRGRIREGIAEVIETFAGLEPQADEETAAQASALTPTVDGAAQVLCVVGRNDLDEAAAGLLVQLLQRRNIHARLVSAEAVVTGEEGGNNLIDVRGTANTRVICLSYMNNSPLKARALIRKLRRRHLMDTKIIAGFWAASIEKQGRARRGHGRGHDRDLPARGSGGNLPLHHARGYVLLRPGAGGGERPAEGPVASSACRKGSNCAWPSPRRWSPGLDWSAACPGGRPAAPAPGVGGPFRLQAGDGRVVTDADFRGSWLLIYFGYTSCPDVCPTTLAGMTAALKRMGSAGDSIRPLFITVDPARDTAPGRAKLRCRLFPAPDGPDRHPGAVEAGGGGVSRLCPTPPDRPWPERLRDGSQFLLLPGRSRRALRDGAGRRLAAGPAGGGACPRHRPGRSRSGRSRSGWSRPGRSRPALTLRIYAQAKRRLSTPSPPLAGATSFTNLRCDRSGL